MLSSNPVDKFATVPPKVRVEELAQSLRMLLLLESIHVELPYERGETLQLQAAFEDVVLERGGENEGLSRRLPPD